MTSEEFWARLIPDGGCLLYSLEIPRRRYCSVKYCGKTWQAHRLSYTLANGPIPDGMYVCHKCDRTTCCSPEHLFLGTQDDNMKDMVSKGRSGSTKGHAYNGEHWTHKRPDARLCGTRNGMAKLDESAVRSIRSMAELSDMEYKDIGKIYGLHAETVGYIVRRKAWAHVV